MRKKSRRAARKLRFPRNAVLAPLSLLHMKHISLPWSINSEEVQMCLVTWLNIEQPFSCGLLWCCLSQNRTLHASNRKTTSPYLGQICQTGVPRKAGTQTAAVPPRRQAIFYCQLVLFTASSSLYSLKHVNTVC